MRNYIIRRLLLVIPTVFLVSVVIFFGMRLIPGSTIDLMLREAAAWGVAYEEIDRAYIERLLGLDVPIFTQYGRWIGVVPGADGSFSGILQGDLGDSLWRNNTVVNEIKEVLPVTIELGFLGIIVAILTSLPMGIYSAIRQDTWGDYTGRIVATGLVALPGFWIALMVVLVGSLWFGISPPLFYVPFTEDPIGSLGQLILPALVLGMGGAGSTMRMARSMMLEVLRQDYIRTAWAKGLRERVVILRHALKNALIPVWTMLSTWIPLMIGGSVIIEIIFGIPGMGRLLVTAIMERDYTIVSGVILCYATFLIVINLFVDLTYSYLDPRIHYK